MHDELLLTVIRAGGSRWETLLAKAITSLLRRALDDGDETFEDVAGRLEDWLLDALCSLRAVNAARGGRGEPGEALAEAGDSLVRLSTYLGELHSAALARVPTRSGP